MFASRFFHDDTLAGVFYSVHGGWFVFLLTTFLGGILLFQMLKNFRWKEDTPFLVLLLGLIGLGY